MILDANKLFEEFNKFDKIVYPAFGIGSSLDCISPHYSFKEKLLSLEKALNYYTKLQSLVNFS